MKLHLIFVFAAFLNSLSSQASMITENDKSLTCAVGYTKFSMFLHRDQVFVPVDTLTLNYLPKDFLNDLLEQDEKNLRIQESGLSIKLESDSCDIDESNPNQIAKCKMNQGAGSMYNILNMNFMYSLKSMAGDSQLISISRSLNLLDTNLRVEIEPRTDSLNKTSDRAILYLEITALVDGHVKTINLKHNLGEWTDRIDRSNWDRCIVTQP